MKKILITSTDLMMLQFLIPHIHYLQESGFKVEVACSEVGGRFREVENTVPENMIVHGVHLLRSPLKLRNIKGYFELKAILRKRKYDVVWTNEPVMGVMTRLAAKKMKKHGLKVIYMAHGFHFFKGAPLKNWLLFYPIERLCSRWTDVLVTINKEDYSLAKKKMHAKQVEYVPGIGIDTAKFMAGRKTENRKRIRAGLGVPKEAKLLLSVGELNENKNHETILRALAGFSEVKEGKVYYVITGKGELEGKLKGLIKSLHLEGKVFLSGYRDDIAAFYDAADIFVFPSYREGPSVALMEAMASGLPCITSDIRGNRDLIDKNGGSLFLPKSIQELKEKMKKMLSMSKEELKQMGFYNLEKVRKFDTVKIEVCLNEYCADILRMGVERSECGSWRHLEEVLERNRIRESLHCTPNDIVLLSVGELSRRKNHEVVIKALARQKEENHIKYFIAGTGELEDYLKRLIKENSLEKQISLLGYRKNVKELLKGADIFVFPSKQEGLSVALMEAMASGLPCIASKIRGNTDLLTDRKGGYLCRPEDVNGFGDRIMRLLKDPLKRDTYGKYNQKRIKEFDIQTVNEKMKKIYEARGE